MIRASASPTFRSPRMIFNVIPDPSYFENLLSEKRTRELLLQKA